MLQEQRRPLEVFCVAAPEDVSFLTRWEEYLLPLQEEGYLVAWSDQHLADEASRQEETLEHLLRADLILLLISPHFFATAECLALMEQALHRHTGEEARVILLLLQPVDGQQAPLMPLLCLPSNGLSVAQWDDTDAAFRDCLQEIFPLAEQRSSNFSIEPQQEEKQHSCLNGGLKPLNAWSWRRAVSSLPGSLLIGTTAGLVAVLLYGLFIWLSDGSVIGFLYALIVGLPAALPVGLSAGILGALLGSALYGFSRGRPAEQDADEYAIEEAEIHEFSSEPSVASDTHHAIEKNEEPVV